jgi:hypothetical protein
MATGGLYGFAWYLIKDQVFCPHGHDTFERQLAARSFFGGLLIATLHHPVSFIYGCAAGLIFGGLDLAFK